MEKKTKGCVYFFKHIGLSPVKIGWTLDDPINNFSRFNDYSPYGSEIIGFIESNRPIELISDIERKYATFKIKDGWFEITSDQVNDEIKKMLTEEQIKEKNDFQIAYSRRNFNISITKKTVNFHKMTERERVIDLLKKNPNICKTELARSSGFSRQSIYRFAEEAKKKYL